MTSVLGIDFGTTNSVIAALDRATGQVRTVRLQAGGMVHDTFRSLLCFWTEPAAGRLQTRHAAGPAAIEAYLEDPLDSRLVMSTKTYLASRNFSATSLMGRTWTLEALIGLFLRELSQAGGLDPANVHITAGRPVRFAGEQPDDAFGEQRLRAAFANAGFRDIGVALEPEAAGYRFTHALQGRATVLVGDFGGGTSDFSVLRFDPGADEPVQTIARSGVGLAGDAFDARIMDRVVAPLLGKGSHYAPWGTPLPVPAEWYSAFARWHRLSMMRSPRTLRDIAEVRRTADAPERLDCLLSLIEDEQGYGLYRAVSDAKLALSVSDSTVLRFEHEAFSLVQPVTRAEFESWIEPDLRKLDAALAEAVAAAGLGDQEIDRVFLTGGTAFVPAVRALFERRFGAERVSGGGEFVSVAEGLALIGAERLSRR